MNARSISEYHLINGHDWTSGKTPVKYTLKVRAHYNLKWYNSADAIKAERVNGFHECCNKNNED